jgi:hypothetical protein
MTTIVSRRQCLMQEITHKEPFCDTQSHHHGSGVCVCARRKVAITILTEVPHLLRRRRCRKSGRPHGGTHQTLMFLFLHIRIMPVARIHEMRKWKFELIIRYKADLIKCHVHHSTLITMRLA